MKLRSLLLLFLTLWLLLNILQAYFTGLMNDEAYYFFYSRDLAWGYYDHPPLTALLIKVGYLLFHNELGVRFLFILLSLGTILIIHKLTESKNDLLFGVLIVSFLFFHITGFLALPDSALVFFTALFFLVYKRYINSHSLTYALLLGLVMAGMFYSKYLGILIVFFTVLSNYRLLLKRSFWLAVAVTTILFIPHLVWQYQHDFPSFYYHLLERSHDEFFRWSNFGDYIGGQFGLTNPFLFIPFLYLLIRFKPINDYERAIKATALGCLLLPFLLMLRGRVEANWTMAGLVPLFLVAYGMFQNRLKMHRFIYISAGITFIIVILARIIIAYNFLPEKYTRNALQDISGWSEFSQRVSELAESRPVVFTGSYQYPSQYIFNAGKEAFSYNNALYRTNQFDLEGIEETLQGREVMLVIHKANISRDDIEKYDLKLTDSVAYPNGRHHSYFFAENYRSYNFIKADILLENNKVSAGEDVEIPLVLHNSSDQPVYFSEAQPGKVYLTYLLLQYGKPLICERFDEISQLVLKDEYRTFFRLKTPAKPGIYYLKVSIKSGWMPAGINSRLVKIRVE